MKTINSSITTKNSKFKKCKLCMYYDTCPKYDDCEYITPIDEDDYCSTLVDELRIKAKCTKENRLYFKPSSYKHNVGTNDGIAPLYSYYKGLINDCLDDIRSGNVGNVFNEYQLEEVMRFHPDINAVYQEGVFYVTL